MPQRTDILLPLHAAALSYAPPVARRRIEIDWVFAFACAQLFCSLALLVPPLDNLRIAWRMGSFGSSLAMLYFLPRRGTYHPAALPALAAMLIVALSLLHPTTNTPLAGLAQVMLYAAIFAPLFWVSGVPVTYTSVRRVMLLLWGFGLLSATVGVIQTYFPGTLEMPISSSIRAQGEWYVEDLKIELANGIRVFRPMGLTDAPGGAAEGATAAILFSLALLVTDRRTWMKALCVFGVCIGMFCLYLCQVRVMLISTLICSITFATLLLLRGQTRQFLQITTLLAGGVVLGFAWAVAIGGDAVTARIESLFADKPSEVYYQNRGRFLDQTVNELLPQYPLGAGLARWGMMNFYFGNNSNPDTKMIWAEIMWTGWLLDGGVPLVIAYFAAIATAIYISARCALDRSVGQISMLGAIVCAYNIGVLATTFNSCPFIGSGGTEFWLLNAALYAAYRHARTSPAEPARVQA